MGSVFRFGSGFYSKFNCLLKYVMGNGQGIVQSNRKMLHKSGRFLGSGVLKDGEDPKKLTENDWRKRLSSEQYYICREKGTERPFTGAYVGHKDLGKYSCVCCGTQLFSSDTKFDSGSGWPSFYDTITEPSDQESNVASKTDQSFGMNRTEVLCKKCGSHLGHVFDDGPRPTKLRYCINSVSLDFESQSQ